MINKDYKMNNIFNYNNNYKIYCCNQIKMIKI